MVGRKGGIMLVFLSLLWRTRIWLAQGCFHERLDDKLIAG